ncbi:MAG: hypothetical protein HZB13_02515 [Acidobacteria bacterium]|nr:hypothetical protein [Acidobacteriota bacterium]
MPYQSATAVEIDSKMREDFRKRLKEYGVSAEATDPVLAVLFRTFAQQLEALYNDTGRIRLALLDELIAGLGIEMRKARPAQTVVRLAGAAAPLLVDAGTTLRSQAQTGARFSFCTDAALTISSAQICFGATYEDGAMRVLAGVDMPERFTAARPSLEPVKVNLGPNPAIYLAIEPSAAEHLSGHSFYFDLSPDARPIQDALAGETWCLAGPHGEFAAAGILRPRAGNAGLRKLEWLISAKSAPASEDLQDKTPLLPDGFYAGRVYLMPVIPPDRRFLCRVPRGLEGPLGRIFGREAQTLFGVDRAWIKVTFPRGLPPLHTGIGGVFMHAITASNVECFNQTIVFERHGTAVPISREGGTDWQLVSPLSIISENETPYLGEMEPSSDASAGRYAIRNGRIELTPARWPDGRPQSQANVRVWISSGDAANQVGPGQVTSIELRGLSGGIKVLNPTSAAGGTNSEQFASAQERFSSALLSRDRVVTRADLYAVVKAFDRRITGARIHSAVERVGGALRRVERITLELNRDDFHDPEVEAGYMREELRASLAGRFLHDIDLSVQVEWTEP